MKEFGWGLVDLIIAVGLWFFALLGIVAWRDRDLPEGGSVGVLFLAIILGAITVVIDALLF